MHGERQDDSGSPLPGSVCFGSTEFHVIRPETGALARWIAGYLVQHEVRRNAQRAMTGGVGQMRVPAAFLETASYSDRTDGRTGTHRRCTRRTAVRPRCRGGGAGAGAGQAEALSRRGAQGGGRRRAHRRMAQAASAHRAGIRTAQSASSSNAAGAGRRSNSASSRRRVEIYRRFAGEKGLGCPKYPAEDMSGRCSARADHLLAAALYPATPAPGQKRLSQWLRSLRSSQLRAGR